MIIIKISFSLFNLNVAQHSIEAHVIRYEYVCMGFSAYYMM